ncbi:MAG: UvrD-helicase domain-containing protein [Planctomycetota bacterium]
MSRPNLLIRASAGSGKTFRLTLRFLDLLLEGEEPQRVFATTFTRKAAGEILRRVLSRLALALLDPKEHDDLNDQLGRQVKRARLAETLVAMTRSVHRLRVDTLDSFFIRLATAFSIELNLPPHWTISDPVDEQRQRERAVLDLLDANPDELRTLVTLLSKGDVRRSVAQQILDLVGGLYPLYLDAPDPAQWRSLDVPEPLDPSALELAISAYEVMPVPLNKSGSSNANWTKAITKGAEALRAADWIEFVKDGFVAKILAGEEQYSRVKISDTARAITEPLIDHAASQLVRMIGDQTTATHDLLSRYHRSYASIVQQSGRFTFDAITRLVAGAQTLGYLDDVYYRLDAELHHVLLDEFQDTSVPQWRILEPLAVETASQPDSHSFFCVGDEKQAIYGWRGGAPEIFGWLEHGLPGLQSEPMDKSYRSAPEIMDTVNAVFGNSAAVEKVFDDDPGVARWLRDFRAHETAKSELKGLVQIRTPEAVKREQPIKTLIAAADFVEDLVRRDPKATIGVLLRRNQAVSRMIYELRKRQIPASDEGGNPLTDSPAVAVVLSALRFAEFPGDTVAAFHVATSPLAPEEVRNAADEPYEPPPPPPEEGPRPRSARPRQPHRHPAIHRLGRTIRRNWIERGPAETIAPLVATLTAISPPRDRRRLEQLVGLAEQFHPAGSTRIREFLRMVEIQKVDDPEEVPVRVMNIHQAKGLEFDRVVLAELDQMIPGQTPPVMVTRDPDSSAVEEISRFTNKSIRALSEYVTSDPSESLTPFHDAYLSREYREALAVLYVAITRAKRELYMFVDPKPTKLARSFAGILRATLTDGGEIEANATVHSHGAVVPKLVSGPSDATGSGDEVVEAAAAFTLAPRRRMRQAYAPSEHEASIGVDQLLEPKAYHALSRGTEVHAALEAIEWMEEVSPEANAFCDSLRSRDALDEWLSRDAFLRRVAEHAPGAPPEQIEVLNEAPFAYADGDQLVSGAIDRLVIAARGGAPIYAEIIDYKTDVLPDDAELERALRRYHGQVESYRAAVRHQFRTSGVKSEPTILAGLLFLDRDRVHLISEGDAPPGPRSEPPAPERSAVPSALQAIAEERPRTEPSPPSATPQPDEASQKKPKSNGGTERATQLDLFGSDDSE